MKREGGFDDHANTEVQESADDELTDREGHGFEFGGVFSEGDDVKRPEQGADEFERVADVDLELPAGGEEKGAKPCQPHCDDGEPVRSFAPKKEEGDRDKDNIEAGDKTCIACRGVNHARLLEGAAEEEEEARNEHPFVLGARHGRQVNAFDKGQDDEGSQQVARAVELIDAAHLSGDALGDEGGAPDDGYEQEGKVGF